jgi:hypothetical protein
MTGSALPPLPADDEVERRLAALKSGADPGSLGSPPGAPTAPPASAKTPDEPPARR